MRIVYSGMPFGLTREEIIHLKREGFWLFNKLTTVSAKRKLVNNYISLLLN